MNVRVYDSLLKWTEGKPVWIAYLAPLAAFGAEPLYRFLTTPSGRALSNRTAERDDAAWEKFYASGFDWARAFPHDTIPENFRPDPNEITGAELLAKGDPEAVQACFALCQDRAACRQLEHELRGGLPEWFAWLLAENLPPPSDQQMQQVLGNQAIAYGLQVVVPHVVVEYRYPQSANRRAVTGPAHHLPTLNRLLAYDPGLVRTDAVRPALFNKDRDETARRFRIGAFNLLRRWKAPTRGEVMIALAGFISQVSHCVLQPLEAPQIRELFDTAETWRSGKRSKREPGLPSKDTTLQKQILRKRNKINEWLDPDKTLQNAVRALRRFAA